MPQVIHAFFCAIPDDPVSLAAGEVCPQEAWNAPHALTYNGSIASSGGSATMSSTDDILEVNVAGSFTANLPTSPINYKPYTIVDGSGGVAIITVSPYGSIIPSGGAWTGYYNGTAWRQTA